jgi:hypothetical protein
VWVIRQPNQRRAVVCLPGGNDEHFRMMSVAAGYCMLLAVLFALSTARTATKNGGHLVLPVSFSPSIPSRPCSFPHDPGWQGSLARAEIRTNGRKWLAVSWRLNLADGHALRNKPWQFQKLPARQRASETHNAAVIKESHLHDALPRAWDADGGFRV